jgi:hypothetical protein
MERQDRKVAGHPMFKCLVCESEASSPVREKVTDSHERAVKAHTEQCNWCWGGTVAFLEMEEADATLRSAIFECQDIKAPCRCGDVSCTLIVRTSQGCRRQSRLPERAWPDLKAEGCLQNCYDLLDREEAEEAWAHKQP